MPIAKSCLLKISHVVDGEAQAWSEPAKTWFGIMMEYVSLGSALENYKHNGGLPEALILKSCVNF